MDQGIANALDSCLDSEHQGSSLLGEGGLSHREDTVTTQRARPLTAAEWQLVFHLRCRAKQGQSLSGDDTALLNRAFGEDPSRYAALDVDVFNATVPVGSNVRRDK
jgi:hypothetical protein